MKNQKRADQIRKMLIQYLNTTEAKTIFENMEFREGDRIVIGETLQVTASETFTKDEFVFRITCNTKSGFREHNETFKI